jgi:hypothetical protein
VKGDELYAWQERRAEGWSVVAGGYVEAGGVQVVRALVTRSRALAEGEFRQYADAHARRTGHAVRLARFKLSVILEVQT